MNVRFGVFAMLACSFTPGNVGYRLKHARSRNHRQRGPNKNNSAEISTGTRLWWMTASFKHIQEALADSVFLNDNWGAVPTEFGDNKQARLFAYLDFASIRNSSDRVVQLCFKQRRELSLESFQSLVKESSRKTSKWDSQLLFLAQPTEGLANMLETARGVVPLKIQKPNADDTVSKILWTRLGEQGARTWFATANVGQLFQNAAGSGAAFSLHLHYGGPGIINELSLLADKQSWKFLRVAKHVGDEIKMEGAFPEFPESALEPLQG